VFRNVHEISETNLSDTEYASITLKKLFTFNFV